MVDGRVKSTSMDELEEDELSSSPSLLQDRAVNPKIIMDIGIRMPMTAFLIISIFSFFFDCTAPAIASEA